MAPPVFIVGNDRSGTTMLRLVLDAGPDVAIPPESMFLTDVDLDAEPRALLEEVWRHPKVALWDLPGRPPPLPPGLPPAEARRFALAAPFAAYAAKHGKPGWGDKTPHYVHHVDSILAVWPDARFVVLVRDGRDVALSLKRMPFGPNNAWAAAQWWARGIRAGRAACRRHPEQVREVRYEDLARRPQEEVPAICAFLGLRYDSAMLALEEADRGKIVPDQASWFPTLFDGISTSAVERWRREMSPREQRVFAALAGAELAELGYPVPDRPVRPVSSREARLFHRHNELLRDVNFVKLRVFQERGRELRVALRRRMQDPVRRQARAR